MALRHARFGNPTLVLVDNILTLPIGAAIRSRVDLEFLFQSAHICIHMHPDIIYIDICITKYIYTCFPSVDRQIDGKEPRRMETEINRWVDR